jgi:hypothetical protein
VFTSTVLAHEAHGCGEDDLASLSRLHSPSRKGLARPYSFYVVYDGYVGVTGEDEVAVHRVDGEVPGHRLLRRG